MKKNRIIGLSACILIICLCSLCKTDPKKNTEDTLRIRLEADITKLNPILPSPGYSRYVTYQIFQNLGKLDPKTLAMQPTLVKAIPTPRTVTDGVHKGAIAFDFEIMEEAAWDNGTPITADDVIFSLKLIFHPLLPTEAFRGYFSLLKTLEPDAQNPRKFTVYYSKYYILALESLCDGIPVYPAYHYDAAAHLKNIPLDDFINTAKITELAKTNPAMKAFSDNFLLPKYENDPKQIVGSGPYQVSSIVPGEGAVLVKKTKYWGDKATTKNPLLAANPPKIIYRLAKDEGATEGLLRNKELDIALNISPTKFLEMQKDADLAKNYTFGTQQPMQYNYWLFNMKNQKLTDVKVRQALAQVVDYDMINNQVYKGMSVRVNGHIHPIKSYYNQDIIKYNLNIAQAQALLAEAGWKDNNSDGIVDKKLGGKSIPLTLNILASPSSEPNKQIAQMLVDNCKKIGIKLEIVYKDINGITQDTKSGQFESAILASVQFAGGDDLYQTFHSNSLAPKGDNRSGYTSKTADALIDQIRSTPDAAQREVMFKTLQQIIYTDVPRVFFVSPMQRYIVSKDFNPVMSAVAPGYYEHLFKRQAVGVSAN